MAVNTATTPFTIGFGDPAATDHAAVGGKAASLGRLTQGGFPIPPGFTVSTAAYASFISQGGLAERIQHLLGQVDYADAEGLESLTGQIRAAIVEAPMPADLAQEILAAYGRLGDQVFVAVRSSGTAEDLAEASFAGMHDTYLDIRGGPAVLDAVRRCWSSLWTARATSYRAHGGYEHSAALLAVVVQQMVESATAGVLFTANPLTARTDEFVVNAAWGLGEGVVSGILSPDEFILDRATRAIKQTTIGGKEVRIVRNRETAQGTVTEPVPEAEQQRTSLDAETVAALGALGERVMEFYGGLPQDIEWSLAGGNLYLLQSRHITGVDFTWDEDVDGWQTLPEREDTVWSHAFADEFWTGAITPLFYSVRAREVHDINMHDFELWGFDDLLQMRWLKWHHGTAYYSANGDRLYDEYLFPSSLRGSTLWKLPPAWREEAARAPFDVIKGIATQVRILVLEPDRSPTNWFNEVEDVMRNRVPEADGPGADALRQMGDAELRASLQRTLDIAHRFIGLLRPAFHYYGVAILGLLNRMVQAWYRGDNRFLFQDLISGMPRETKTAAETRAVWRVAMTIRSSPALTALFEQHQGAEFFARAADSEEGRRFLDVYQSQLIEPHGHRGHADRDIWYSRRVEDPALDYQAFRSFIVAGDGPTPEELEHRLIEQRKRATAEMLAGLGGGLLGGAKAELFKLLHAYVLKFLMVRDDERHYIDRVTFAKKKHFTEIGRRLVERGVLERPDDFYFLAETELYDAFEGNGLVSLLRAKVVNRRRLFERYLARDIKVEPYIQGGRPIQMEGDSTADDAAGGLMRGTGVSRGSVTATARVVGDLKNIGRVQKGDILICNSTDPGWASVFAIISGLVMETGGMLAHGSCLSREYNLPAVTLRHAMALIEDGATITVNGDTGEVRVASEQAPRELEAVN